MGYVRGFIHGGVAGIVAGLCLAPQPGRKTRDQLAGVGAAMREGYDLAQKTVRRVAPYAQTAAQAAREKVKRSDDDDGGLSVDGTVRVRAGNGRSG